MHKDYLILGGAGLVEGRLGAELEVGANCLACALGQRKRALEEGTGEFLRTYIAGCQPLRCLGDSEVGELVGEFGHGV